MTDAEPDTHALPTFPDLHYDPTCNKWKAGHVTTSHISELVRGNRLPEEIAQVYGLPLPAVIEAFVFETSAVGAGIRIGQAWESMRVTARSSLLDLIRRLLPRR